MKNIKLNILQFFILFFSVVCIIGCSNEESEAQIEQAVVENLNTSANRQLITDLFTKGTKANKQLIEQIKNQKLSGKSNEVNVDELLIEYQDCSTCALEYKSFLIPFFQKTKDLNFENEIISKIQEYELKLEQSNLDEISKDNLRFTLYSFKELAIYIKSNPNPSSSKKTANLESEGCGRALGQGMVSGFVAGCIKGGIAGAGGGTVALPIIGTVTGAVAGCMGGGAVGAVVSGFSSWLWCVIK